MKQFLFLCCMCVSILVTAQNLIPFRKGNLWGYSDEKGTLVINPLYDSVTFFNSNNPQNIKFAEVYKSNKTGYITTDGKYIIPLYVQDLNYVNVEGIGYQNAIIAKVEGKYGVIDFSNKLIVPFEYDTIQIKARYKETPFGPEYLKQYDFYAKKKSKMYCINQNGTAREISKTVFDNSVLTSYGVMMNSYDSHNVNTDDFEPFIQLIIQRNSQKIDSISPKKLGINSTFHTVYYKNKVGVASEFELLKDSITNWISPVYDSLIDIILDYNDSPEKFIFLKDNKITIVNVRGKVIMEPKYEGALYKSDYKFILLQNNGKIGCYFFNTNDFIPTMYDSITYIGRNLFYVNKNGISYYITNKNFAYYSE